MAVPAAAAAVAAADDAADVDDDCVVDWGVVTMVVGLKVLPLLLPLTYLNVVVFGIAVDPIIARDTRYDKHIHTLQSRIQRAHSMGD